MDLVSQNDKVAVPGLGLFFTIIVPATLSDNRAVINPPRWQLRFTKKDIPLSEGFDFISQIRRQMVCSYEQAVTELSWCIDRLKNELEQTKSCEIPGLGRMRADSQNDYYFVIDDGVEVSLAGLGFEPVYIKAPEVVQTKKKHKVWPIILLTVIMVIIAVIVFAYCFKDMNVFANDIYLWIDNILNHILYSAEELELLGL